MLRYAFLAVITLTAVLANENSNYTFNYKLPKISADMVLKMKDKLKHTIFDMARGMEKECKYVKAMSQYGFEIEMALLARNSACSVDNDITQLEKYKDTYKTSLISCFKEMNSTDTFNEMIDKVVVKIQTIDQTAKTEADACSGDEECEKQVYAKTHSAMTEMYGSGTAELKVAEDQAITDGLSGIVKCMIPKISDSLKEMYVAIETLQSCIADGADAKSSASTKPDTE